MERPDEQTVIEMHYLDHVKWWPICAALFSGEPDYAEKADKYLKRTFKLHGSALQGFLWLFGLAHGLASFLLLFREHLLELLTGQLLALPD